MKILSKQDFNKNESKNFVIDNLSEAPQNPIKGQTYYNTTDDRAYVCISNVNNNPLWVDMSLGEEVEISETEPTGRDINLWINPNDTVPKNNYDALPVGSIIDYDGTTVPEGYIKISESGSIMRIKKTYETATLTGDVIDSLDGNSTYNAPSINAVNNTLDWKLFDTVTADTQLTLPTNYNELYIVIHTDRSIECLENIFPKTILSQTARRYTIGGRFMFMDGGVPIAWGADCNLTLTTYKLYRFYVNGGSVLSNAISEIYYR